jgi:polyphosphate glucokinase
LDQIHSDVVKIPSGMEMTCEAMVKQVKAATSGWGFTHVAIGYPGPVVRGHPAQEPHNLGPGWVGFDFPKAFGCPVRLVNDAAMQAMGSYEGGRMLFLGLGTGLGSALIVDGVLAPLELAHLPYKNGKSYEEYVGVHGMERLGKAHWRKHVAKVATLLKHAMVADYVVLGGGNAKQLKELPSEMELGDNSKAFKGGFRLWEGLPNTGDKAPKS